MSGTAPGAAAERGRGPRELFGIADTVYLVESANNTYNEGGLLDAGWPIAACLIAIAAWQPMANASQRSSHSMTEQALIGGFAALAIGVLIADLVTPVNMQAEILAVAAMVAIVIRLVIAAHESRQIEQCPPPAITHRRLDRPVQPPRLLQPF